MMAAAVTAVAGPQLDSDLAHLSMVNDSVDSIHLTKALDCSSLAVGVVAGAAHRGLDAAFGAVAVGVLVDVHYSNRLQVAGKRDCNCWDLDCHKAAVVGRRWGQLGALLARAHWCLAGNRMAHFPELMLLAGFVLARRDASLS